MFSLEMRMSEDRSSVAVTVPAPTGSMTAAELEQFIRDLAMLRANMRPAVPNEGMKPNAVWSSVPCNRWQTMPDPEFPKQIRLFLQHLGMGWVFVPLSEEQAGELQDGLQKALRDRPSIS